MRNRYRKIKIEIEVSELVGLNLGVFIHASALGGSHTIPEKSRMRKTIAKIGKDITQQVIAKGEALEQKANKRRDKNEK